MANESYKGEVKAPVIPLRFSKGGKVSWCKVQKGKKEKKGQALAGLDLRQIEIQHKIELADYQRARAEFDKLSRQIPETKTDDEKTEKQIAQAKLDKAVKAVEKTQLELDEMTMISPVNGVVIEDSNLRAGMRISPASFEIEILEIEKSVMELEVDYEVIEKQKWNSGDQIKIMIEEEEVETSIAYISPLIDDGKIELSLKISEKQKLWPGEKVVVSFLELI